MIYTFQCCGQTFSDDEIGGHLKTVHEVDLDTQKFERKQENLIISVTHRLTCDRVSLLMVTNETRGRGEG